MLPLLKHELFTIVAQPVLWLLTLMSCVFLIYSVGNLRIEGERVRVAFYQTQADTPAMVETLSIAESYARETADVDIADPSFVKYDIATEMLRDGVDIAIIRTLDGWRLILRSRSGLEHRRLVRVAQLLGESISQREPWLLIAYDGLSRQEQSAEYVDQWPKKYQISGITADPGDDVRIFIPKTIALLANCVTFAFAARSMMRDITSNALLPILVSCKSNWVLVLIAKAVVSTMMGLLAFLVLIVFAAEFDNFHIKEGLPLATALVSIGLLISAIVGISLSLLGRNVQRIYLFGSFYLVLLFLISGFVAKIDAEVTLLYLFSRIIALSYSMDMLSDWMFFGVNPSIGARSVSYMIALFVLSIVMVNASVIYFRRKL